MFIPPDSASQPWLPLESPRNIEVKTPQCGFTAEVLQQLLLWGTWALVLCQSFPSKPPVPNLRIRVSVLQTCFRAAIKRNIILLPFPPKIHH